MSAAEPIRHSGRFTWLITLLVSLAFAGNGMTLSTVSFALPGIRREWDLTPFEIGAMGAAVSAGQFGGSLLIGWLADRWGRRRTFTLTVAIMASAIGLAGLAPSPGLVVVLLFICGLGFGGVSPVAVSILGEFAPPRVRGQLMAWTQVFWSTGWCLIAFGGALITAALGWHWIFALGATPIALAIVAWRLTPESPRFLLAHGRRPEAEALVRDLEARYGVHLPLPAQQRARRRASPLDSLRELWGPALWRRTLTLWLTWMIMVAAFNGPIILLPAILVAASGNEAIATRASLLVGLLMVPSCLFSVLLIDRIGRRRLLMAGLGVGALGSLGLGLARDELPIILSGGALAGGVLAAWPITLSYCAELYPTRMRATAAGWAGAVSRLGGVGAPLLLGALLGPSGGGIGLGLGLFGLLLLLAIVLVAALGEETAGRTLEELSG